MRVSHLSRYSAFSLFGVSALLLAALIIGLERLDDAAEQLESYQQLKQKIVVDLGHTINRYLSTGNALELSAAEQLLTQLPEQELRQLEADVAAPMAEALTSLLNNLTTKYRALGKLSGNSQGLLLNAERELSGYAETAVDYGYKAQALGRREAADYVRLGAALLVDLQSLSFARANYFETGDDEQVFLDQVNRVQSVANKIGDLPLLGVMSEVEVDEFALGDDEEEAYDLAEEMRQEIVSLARRYPKEMASTTALIRERTDTQQALSDEVAQLTALILEQESLVKLSSASIVSTVELALYGCAGLILIVALFSYLAIARMVLAPLRRLRDSFRQLVEDGHLNRIDNMAKNSELGEIANYFNVLLDNQQGDERRKVEQLKLVSDALASVKEQVNHISSTTEETEQQVATSREVMEQLASLSTQLNAVSTDVEQNARETQESMTASQQGVEQVMGATEATDKAVKEGRESLASLSQSVEDVNAILDVIRGIADQTNLLALNAAIESARAGVHGRGFAVVADEVRKLSHKTQESLSEITQILTQLGESSVQLQGNIQGIEDASRYQHEVSQSLLKTADQVLDKSRASADVAHQASEYVKQQSDYVTDFARAMDNVQAQVEEARTLSFEIERDVEQQVGRITQTLGMA
ncbi:methyl-accepting chemotaxis protein [Corallincola platygyrae]|uniref:Methyl-accepting chemotaxis protein n=1 Tax=Corallincola platygyrae TaxID=1193278 RepID=A0ABW4XP10_9GAMM